MRLSVKRTGRAIASTRAIPYSCHPSDGEILVRLSSVVMFARRSVLAP